MTRIKGNKVPIYNPNNGKTSCYMTPYIDYTYTSYDDRYVYNISLGVLVIKSSSPTTHNVSMRGEVNYYTNKNGSGNKVSKSGTKNITPPSTETAYTVISSFSVTSYRVKGAETYVQCVFDFSTNAGGGGIQSEDKIKVPALPTYKITFNANGGVLDATLSKGQTKYYGESLSLLKNQPSPPSGYVFKGWATSTSNASIGQIAYASGASYTTNDVLNLYAIYELPYASPRIINYDIVRSNSSGVESDDGTCAKFKFDWSIYTSSNPQFIGGSSKPYIDNSVSSCDVIVTMKDGTTKTGSTVLSGTSGTEDYVLVTGDYFELDKAYNASLSITDSQTAYTTKKTTTVYDQLAAMHFSLDFNSTATSLGIFCPAPDNKNVVYVGAQFMASSMAGMIQMTAVPAGGPGSPTLVPVDNTTIYEPIHGWLICNGASVSRDIYPELFNAIQYTYGGSGDNFNLPDLTGRFPLGSNGTYTLNKRDGEATHILTAAESGVRAHTHSVGNHYHSLSAHTHELNHSHYTYYVEAKTSTTGSTRRFGPFGSSASGAEDIITSGATNTTTSGPNANATSSTTYSTYNGSTLSGTPYTGGVKDISGASGSAHNNMPPYVGVNFIIATGKIY